MKMHIGLYRAKWYLNTTGGQCFMTYGSEKKKEGAEEWDGAHLLCSFEKFLVLAACFDGVLLSWLTLQLYTWLS